LRHVLRISCSVLRFRSRSWVTITMPPGAAISVATTTAEPAIKVGMDPIEIAIVPRDAVMPLWRCRSGLCPERAGRWGAGRRYATGVSCSVRR